MMVLIFEGHLKLGDPSIKFLCNLCRLMMICGQTKKRMDPLLLLLLGGILSLQSTLKFEQLMRCTGLPLFVLWLSLSWSSNVTVSAHCCNVPRCRYVLRDISPTPTGRTPGSEAEK
jgi:hypothetical protein